MTERTWLRLMRIGAAAGCHQRPDRSFFIGDWQFPVCARCCGLPVGWLLAPLLIPLRPPLWLGPLLQLPMAVDWGLQRFAGLPSNHVRRFVTGALGGLGYLSFVFNIIAMLIALW